MSQRESVYVIRREPTPRSVSPASFVPERTVEVRVFWPLPHAGGLLALFDEAVAQARAEVVERCREIEGRQRELAQRHRGEVVPGSGRAVEPRDFR